MQEFSCPTQLVVGAGASDALARFGAKRIFVVASPESVRSGAALRFAAHAGEGEHVCFDGIGNVPTDAQAAEGAAALRRFRPELVLAYGGENILDGAKVICFCARGNVPLVTVPTGPDGGAAVAAEATVHSEGKLLPLAEPRLRPRMAIYDSTEKPPARVVAEDGFALLCCALETAVSTRGSVFSELAARESFARAFARLPAAFAGHASAIAALTEASALSGLARCDAGLGLCRAIARSLELHFGVSCARVSAVLLPGVVRCNAQAVKSKYAILARGAGLTGSTDDAAVKSLLTGLLRVRRELGLPQTLAQAGIAPRELWEKMPELVETALKSPCCRNNPMPPEDFWVRRVLHEAEG